MERRKGGERGERRGGKRKRVWDRWRGGRIRLGENKWWDMEKGERGVRGKGERGVVEREERGGLRFVGDSGRGHVKGSKGRQRINA